jgi:hypothetical protein
MKILLGEFNAEVGREDIFTPTAGNERLEEIGNDNGIRVVNFATSKNLIVKSIMFPHCNIHKFTWMPTKGNTRHQINHTLADRRWHSSVLDVRSFRGADCGIDHYLVVEKVRERLAVSIHTTHKFQMERFNLNKLNEVEGKEQYRVEISNRCMALESLDDDGDINRAWQTIKENMKVSAKESLGYYELKKHERWFDKGCSELLDQRKEAKLQWLRDPSQINGEVKLVGISKTERGNILKTKLMSLQLTVTTRTLETCLEKQMKL